MAHPAGRITAPLDLGEIDGRHRGVVLAVWVDGPDMQTLRAHFDKLKACDAALRAGFWSPVAQGKLVLWLWDAWGMDPAELGDFTLAYGPLVYLRAARASAAMLVEHIGETLAALSLAQQTGRVGRA